MKDFKFEAVLQKAPDMDACYVVVPKNKNDWSEKGRVKVKASIDGIPYRGSIVRMEKNGPLLLPVLKDIRNQFQKDEGDLVYIALREDLEERFVETPPELLDFFAKHPDIELFFKDLSFTNQKEYVFWLTSAVREETKQARVKMMKQKLLERKKNPFER